MKICWCCCKIIGRPLAPAVAAWICGTSGNLVMLCQACLDFWFDNADDDPDLEPIAVVWLDDTRTLAAAR